MKLVGQAIFALIVLAAGCRVAHQLMAFEITRLYQEIEPLKQAVQIDPEGPGAHYLLGVIYANNPEQQDLELAQHHLERATTLNPYNWWYWMELGEVYEISGMRVKSEQSYAKAVEINPEAADYHWRFANFYLRNGALGKAIPEFQKALELEPKQYMEQALALLSKAGVSDNKILEMWPEDRYSRIVLIKFLMGRLWPPWDSPGHIVDEVALKEEWEKLFEDPKIPTVVEGDFYIRYLADKGRLSEAKSEWLRLNEENLFESLVWNGEFKAPMSGRVLGWEYDTEWVCSPKSGEDGIIKIEFQGKKNLNFDGFKQLVVLEEGENYELSFRARSEGISTDQGLYFEITKDFVLLRTKQILGNTPWTEYSNKFKAPKGVRFVILSLRRYPSKRIDNKLKGAFWLDWVRLKKVTSG